MKKLLAVVFVFTLIPSTTLSQGMRDTLNSYDASERCFSMKGWSNKNKPQYCLYENGSIHSCFLQSASSCWKGSLVGKLNQRVRLDLGNIQLHEYYIEDRNLVNYSCYEGTYKQCSTRPEKEVFYPF